MRSEVTSRKKPKARRSVRGLMVWAMRTPNGAVSGGFCKRCGATREFRNSSEDLMWDSDSFSLNGSRFRGRRSESNS